MKATGIAVSSAEPLARRFLVSTTCYSHGLTEAQMLFLAHWRTSSKYDEKFAAGFIAVERSSRDASEAN